MADVAYGTLPFNEQIAFFRRKLNINTRSWLDVFESQHDHAFMVAGANRADLVQDFREAVDAAIAQGETLQQFRKRFDAIVAKYGWDYNGGRNWRSRVIYETNLRTSYAAGRFAQLQRMKKSMPYWKYVHAPGETHPRPEHLAWNGLVLAADDPWWNAHFPPNGWGCKCTVQALDKRDIERLGKTGPDTAPPSDVQPVIVGQRSPGGPRVVDTPAGIDPGFGYTPGRDAWVRDQVSRTLQQADAEAKRTWEPMIQTTYSDVGRADKLPLETPPVAPLKDVPANADAVVQVLRDTLGAPERVYDVHGLPVAVNGELLGKHLAHDLDRARYLPLLNDLLLNPQEVWLQIERERTSGEYRERARILKAYDVGHGNNLLFVADQQDGVMVGWTFLHTGDVHYVNKQRQGVLVYGAPE